MIRPFTPPLRVLKAPAAILSLALLLTACQEAAFRTPLDDLPETVQKVPSGFEGVYLYAEEAEYREYRSSGLEAETYIEHGIGQEPDWLKKHKVYSVHVMPDRHRLVFGNLIPFLRTNIDSGAYRSDDFTIEWERVLDHVLKVRIRRDTDSDVTRIVPVWPSGRLYFTTEYVTYDKEEDPELNGYHLVHRLDSATLESASEWELEPTLVKVFKGTHYLIQQRDDGFFQIEQYRLTDFGFTRRSVNELSLPQEENGEDITEFMKTLSSLRKLVPADTVGGIVVLDPKAAQLDPLFRSNFARTEYFIRVEPETHPARWGFPQAWLIGLAALAVLIWIILRGRRKTD